MGDVLYNMFFLDMYISIYKYPYKYIIALYIYTYIYIYIHIWYLYDSINVYVHSYVTSFHLLSIPASRNSLTWFSLWRWGDPVLGFHGDKMGKTQMTIATNYLVGGFNHLENNINISQWEGLSHIFWKIKNNLKHFETTNQTIVGEKLKWLVAGL